MVSEENPEVVVVMFGANDPQPLQGEAGRLAFGTPEWEAEYRNRVRTLMVLASQGRRLIWVGEPIVRDAELDAKMQVIDRIQREEALQVPNVTFVDARALFAGPDGGYSDYVVTADGSEQRVRAGDGIHPNGAGYDRLTEAVMAEILRLTDPAQAAAPAPAAAPPTPAG